MTLPRRRGTSSGLFFPLLSGRGVRFSWASYDVLCVQLKTLRRRICGRPSHLHFPPSSYSNTAAIAEYGRNNNNKKSKNNNKNVAELLFSSPKGKTNGAECFSRFQHLCCRSVHQGRDPDFRLQCQKKRKLKGKTIEVRTCMLCCSRYSLLPFPFSIVADTVTREKQFFFYYELSYMNIHRTNCIDTGSLAYRYTHSRRHINSKKRSFFLDHLASRYRLFFFLFFFSAFRSDCW